MPKVAQLASQCPAFIHSWTLLKFFTGQLSFTALDLIQNLVFIKIILMPSLPQRAIVSHFCHFFLSGFGHRESELVQLYLSSLPEHPATNYTCQRQFPSKLAGGGVWRST